MVKGHRWSSDGRWVKSLVGGEDDGCVRGPQRPRGGPKQCRAQEGGLDEGGGAHWVTQSQWVSRHCAQSWLGEGAGQEASCQALGQLLLQGQFGLRGEGGEIVLAERFLHGRHSHACIATPSHVL